MTLIKKSSSGKKNRQICSENTTKLIKGMLCWQQLLAPYILVRLVVIQKNSHCNYSEVSNLFLLQRRAFEYENYVQNNISCFKKMIFFFQFLIITYFEKMDILKKMFMFFIIIQGVRNECMTRSEQKQKPKNFPSLFSKSQRNSQQILMYCILKISTH